jgi:hypothetical protein
MGTRTSMRPASEEGNAMKRTIQDDG